MLEMGDAHGSRHTRLPAPSLGPSTQAVHADDDLNNTQDVAPPLHVSTTFRYADDPESLVPAAETHVRLLP